MNLPGWQRSDSRRPSRHVTVRMLADGPQDQSDRYFTAVLNQIGAVVFNDQLLQRFCRYPNSCHSAAER